MQENFELPKYSDENFSLRGCVNAASWLPLAAGIEFTQPRAHIPVQGLFVNPGESSAQPFREKLAPESGECRCRQFACLSFRFGQMITI